MSLAGKKLGGYSVQSELGAGGMAVIYKATQPSLDRLVAIKELRTEFTKDKSILTRFEREAKSLASLTHHNIVHIYDYLEKGSSMFIVMEHVDGIDLYNLLQRVERLPPDIAAIIALQAARALEYAHFRGVVHRDFKPSNLMLTKEGEVKLMDFGIARDEAFDDLTRPGTALGTPAYMSPEQIMGKRVDFRSDLFSFGIVLYQMLTGKKPFTDDESNSAMQKIINDKYRSPRRIYPDIPYTLHRIIKRCLDKDPDKRFQSTEILRRKLERFVARKVRINYQGRLLIYLRHRDLVSDHEAQTYVRSEDLNEPRTKTIDAGQVNVGTALIRPMFQANFVAAVALAAWVSVVHLLGLGQASGYVHVNAKPWADVYVDGRLHDTTPFAKPLKLLPGKHQIEFRNHYYLPEKREVQIDGGDTLKVNVELKRGKRK